MISKLSKEECTLCQACSEICPKKCIEYKEEFYSFLYPVIDHKKCINCNLCEKVCPILNPLDVKESKKEIFASKILDEKVREKSSSGGIFSAIAEKTLNENGAVCGVKFDAEFNTVHQLVSKLDDLDDLRGSKYVQSYTNDSYKDIKKALIQNQKVLFSGCPCQVAGLKKFLNREYENLLTIDLICHGIPSQKLFEEYRGMLEKKYRSKIIEFKFREKSKGWHNSSVRATFENGKVYTKVITEDAYMRGYFKNMTVKPACHKCNFRNFKCGSDITLGDFWGAEIEAKNIDDDKGLSLVICNSSAGLKAIENLSSDIYLENVDFDKATFYNQSLFSSFKANPLKDDFFEYGNKYGYNKAFTKYCKQKWYEYLIKNIRMRLGSIKRSLLTKGQGK